MEYGWDGFLHPHPTKIGRVLSRKGSKHVGMMVAQERGGGRFRAGFLENCDFDFFGFFFFF